jgi:hypothetical protein
MDGIRAGAGEIADRCVHGIRLVDAIQLAGTVQPGQHTRIQLYSAASNSIESVFCSIPIGPTSFGRQNQQLSA